MKFLKDEIRNLLAEAACPQCGEKGARGVLSGDGPHCAKAECSACGRFLDWIAWPDEAKEKRDRTRSRKAGLRINGETCEICLRVQGRLPKAHALTVHHVIEKVDGGSDDPDNLRTLCSRCHSLVHWLRVTLKGGGER